MNVLHSPDELRALTQVDLNLLVVLEALLVERQVGRAAARLHLTQSAVSHALNRLREIFNDPLFTRVALGVVPTARALALAEPLASVLGEVRKILTPECPFNPQLATDRIVLGTTDYASAEVMPPLVSLLEKSAPGIRLVIRNLRLDNIVSDLDTREYDVAIAPVSDRMPKRIASVTLFEDHIILAARRNHPLLRDKLTLLSFRKLRHLLVASSRSENTTTHTTLRPYGLGENNVGMMVPHFLAAAFVVAQSNLVMLVPSRLSRRLTQLAGLASHELPIPSPPTFKMGLLFCRERAVAEPALAWLISSIQRLGLSQPTDGKA